MASVHTHKGTTATIKFLHQLSEDKTGEGVVNIFVQSHHQLHEKCVDAIILNSFVTSGTYMFHLQRVFSSPLR
jgi:hypothetical protein